MIYEVGDRLITPDNQKFQIKEIRPEVAILMDESSEFFPIDTDLLHGYQGKIPRAVLNFKKID